MRITMKPLVGAMIALGLAAPTQASLIFTLKEIGADVVASGSGTANVTGLSDGGAVGGS